MKRRVAVVVLLVVISPIATYLGIWQFANWHARATFVELPQPDDIAEIRVESGVLDGLEYMVSGDESAVTAEKTEALIIPRGRYNSLLDSLRPYWRPEMPLMPRLRIGRGGGKEVGEIQIRLRDGTELLIGILILCDDGHMRLSLNGVPHESGDPRKLYDALKAVEEDVQPRAEPRYEVGDSQMVGCGAAPAGQHEESSRSDAGDSSRSN